MIKQAEPTLTIDGLEDFYSTLLDRAPDWFKDFRADNRTQAWSTPIPSVKHEEWKYTNLSPITQQSFHLPTGHDLKFEEKLWEYASKDDINIVMVNGCFVSEYSNFTNVDGIKIVTIQEAVENGQIDKDLFLRSTVNDAQPFVNINNAYHRCGAYINIDPRVKEDRLIHIIHVDTNEEGYFIFPRTMINVARSAEASVLESHISMGNSNYLINALTDIFLDENAQLHYTKAQAESMNATHVGSTRCWQKRDSRLDSFSLMVGGKLTRNNVSVISQGEGTDTVVDGLYVLQGDQHVDNHTLVDHTQPNCTSHQLYKGILNDKSRAVFNGKIFVKQIAQQTNSYQLNKNLLLGPDCRVDTKPQLEIFADDVRCTHGATIGQLSPEELFYLQTRCISKEEAVRMLCGGFIDEIINTVHSASAREKLNQLIEKRTKL